MKGILRRAAFWKNGSKADDGAPARDDVPGGGPYVGRDDDIARFEADLRNEPKVVIAISGDPGMGKRTLLRRCQQTAAAGGVVTAWTDTTGNGVPAMLASLA